MIDRISDVFEDYEHPELFFSSGRRMQLDVYIPNEQLALEYQGEQHFYDAYNIGPQWNYQQRDQEKRLACKKHGITIIEIPYWWNRKKESLLATIHAHRRDLIPIATSVAIPDK